MNQPQNKSPRVQYARSIGNSTDRALHCELLEDRRLLTAVVISTSPLTASASVPVDTNIEATFNATISPASVTDQSFVVHSHLSGKLSSSGGDIASLAGVGPVVTLDPASNFYPGELVQVTATASLLDDSSIAVAPYVWDFRVATSGGSGALIDSGQALGSGASWHVALGDVDSDGDLDALVTNLQTGNYPPQDSRLWLNQGGQQGGIAGQFVDSGQSLENIRPHDLALGDLDGDGDLDAFFGNSSANPNTIWLNQGGQQGGMEGQFADSGQRMGSSATRGVSLGDLDGDGDLDAFIANRGDQSNRVWINQGGVQGGTMGQFVDSGQVLGNSTSFDVELGDLDEDGDLDAFVANGARLGTPIPIPQPNLVWMNDGSGTFTDSGQMLGNFTSFAVSLGDVDGDGDLDAFATNEGSNQNRIWLNQGGTQGGIAGQYADSGQTIASPKPHDAALGDLDGDGDLDVFIANIGGAPNVVWINQGGAQGGIAGQFADSGYLLLASSTARGVALGDLDNDGELDAFVTNYGASDIAQPNTVWLNRNVSADFDLDNDIDGADFLTWQSGFGITTGATLANGDADENGTVDSADLAIWESQMGTSVLLVATSFESQSVQPSTNLISVEPIAPALRQLDVNFNVWLVLPTNGREVANRNGPHRLGIWSTASPSIQHVDRALENLFPEVGFRDMRQSTLRPLEAILESRAVVRMVGDTAEEEKNDAVVADWDGDADGDANEDGIVS